MGIQVREPDLSGMAAVGAVILASAVTLIYAHKVYVQEIESEKRGKD
jgi:hypothetical protein